MEIGGTEAVIVVGALVMASGIQELIKIFFVKMRASDYVKRSACVACKAQEKEICQGQKEKIDAIAKLVLAMAIKMGVDTSEISKLLV